MIKIDNFRTLSFGTKLVKNDKPKNDDDVENAMLTGIKRDIFIYPNQSSRDPTELN